MKKFETKTMFKAILNVNGKEKAFSKSYTSVPRLIKALKENGIPLSTVTNIKEFRMPVGR
jgi:hypothetical protein